MSENIYPHTHESCFLHRPEHNLYVAILAQAFRDLSSKDQDLRKDAYLFLTGPIAKSYAELIEMEPALLTRAIMIQTSSQGMKRFMGMVPAQKVTTIISASPDNNLSLTKGNSRYFEAPTEEIRR